MLQAESEKLRQAWIQAVQASIASAYRESPDTYYIEVLVVPQTHSKQSGKSGRLLVMTVCVRVCPSSHEAPGQNGVAVHQQHRLGQRASRAQRARRHHPAAHPVSAGERAVLRLRPGRPPLGLHQPGHPAVHRVLRNTQVRELQDLIVCLFETIFNNSHVETTVFSEHTRPDYSLDSEFKVFSFILKTIDIAVFSRKALKVCLTTH